MKYHFTCVDSIKKLLPYILHWGGFRCLSCKGSGRLSKKYGEISVSRGVVVGEHSKNGGDVSSEFRNLHYGFPRRGVRGSRG